MAMAAVQCDLSVHLPPGHMLCKRILSQPFQKLTAPRYIDNVIRVDIVDNLQEGLVSEF